MPITVVIPKNDRATGRASLVFSIVGSRKEEEGSSHSRTEKEEEHEKTGSESDQKDLIDREGRPKMVSCSLAS